MVVQLAAKAAARSKGSKVTRSKAMRRAKAAYDRPELVGKIAARERRRQRQNNPITPAQRKRLHANSQKALKLRKKVKSKFGGLMSKEAESSVTKVNAVATSWMIAATLFPLISFQFFFWIIAMIGVFGESIPILNYVFPGETLFGLGVGVNAVIGLLMMLWAVTMYVGRGVDCWSGGKTLAFAFCFSLQIAPLINLIPFVLIWCFIVALLQPQPEPQTT